jgi:myo-inositol-1(or 4)-monophosphatase
VSGIDGAPADHTMLIAAPPAIFPALHDALAKLDAAGGP